jgi:hypothetical protein
MGRTVLTDEEMKKFVESFSVEGVSAGASGKWLRMPIATDITWIASSHARAAEILGQG